MRRVAAAVAAGVVLSLAAAPAPEPAHAPGTAGVDPATERTASPDADRARHIDRPPIRQEQYHRV